VVSSILLTVFVSWAAEPAPLVAPPAEPRLGEPTRTEPLAAEASTAESAAAEAARKSAEREAARAGSAALEPLGAAPGAAEEVLAPEGPGAKSPATARERRELESFEFQTTGPIVFSGKSAEDEAARARLREKERRINKDLLAQYQEQVKVIEELEKSRHRSRGETRREEETVGPSVYFRDRLLDLADIFRFRVHVPRGFRSVGFKVRHTALLQAGFVYFEGVSYGFDRRGAGIWREKRLEGGVGPVYATEVWDDMVTGNEFTDLDRPWSKVKERRIVRDGIFWDDGRRHPLGQGFELQLGLFGVEFEAYPLEVVDFIVGWTTLDPFQDDFAYVIPRWKRLQRTPELQVRNEWEETLEPEEKAVPLRPEGHLMRPEDKLPQPETEPYLPHRPGPEPLSDARTAPLPGTEETTSTVPEK
jgi:hypothetical protein